MIYLKIVNGKVKAYGDPIAKYDRKIADSAWEKYDYNAFISGGKIVLGSNFKKTSFKDKVVSGGVQEVYGTAHNTKILRGGSQNMNGGSAYNTVISSGGRQRIYSEAINEKTRTGNGFTSGTLIYNGGKQAVVAQGASSYDTTIFSGGSQKLYNGTYAYNTIISGGEQKLYPGAVANKTNIKANGIQILQNEYGYSASTLGVAKNTTVSSGGTLQVYASCVASSAKILNGGSMEIYSGGKAVSLTMNSGAKLNLAGNATVTGKTNLNGVALSVSSVDNKLGTVTTNNSTKVTYKLSSVSAKSTNPMLKLSSNTAQNGQYTISVKKTQGIGTYELSENIKQANDTAYTLKLGSTTISTLKLNSGSSAVNGVTYSLKKSGAKVNLTLAMKAGVMKNGNASNNTLTGTSHCDIFYGGKGNDKIDGTNGRDVAVYDTTAWGKDVISKTSGTMTILFNDLASSDISKSLKSGTMTITRNSDTSQKVTISGWDNATHKIVYTSNMTSFNDYLKAISPTSTQQAKARTEVWKKAGLASA